MAGPSLDEVATILGARALGRLVGLKEGDCFEVKGKAPYNLDEPQGRYELGKDVTAFANSGGGYLIVGLTHQKVATENTEVVTGLDLMVASDFNVTKYRGVVGEYVYPQVKDLQVAWIEDDTRGGNGVGVIFVPPQEGDLKPFLITRVVEDGQPLKQNVAGVARRVGADNTPFTAKQLYDALRRGSDSPSQRLTRVEEKLDRLLELIAEEPGRAHKGKLLSARIERVLED